MIILNEMTVNSVHVQNAIAKAHKILNDPNSNPEQIARAHKSLRNMSALADGQGYNYRTDSNRNISIVKHGKPREVENKEYYFGGGSSTTKSIETDNQNYNIKIHAGKRKGKLSGTSHDSYSIYTGGDKTLNHDTASKLIKDNINKDAAMRKLDSTKRQIKEVQSTSRSKVEAPKSNSTPPVANTNNTPPVANTNNTPPTTNTNSNRKSINKTEILQKRKDLLKSNNATQNPKNIARGVSLPRKSSSGSWLGRNKGKVALGVGLGAAAAYGIHRYMKNKKKKEEEKNRI